MAYCLHFALQKLHIQPGVFLGLRTANDPVPKGERAFMLASIKKALKEGDYPVSVRSFSKNPDKEGTK